MKPVTLTRRVTFSSGHRYHFESVSEEENRLLFGRWTSRFNHGHNYVLYCTITGEVDESTGMVVNIKDLDELLQHKVVGQFDQKSINDEVEHFRDQAPCLENLLHYIGEQLALTELGNQWTQLRLEESPGLSAELERKGKKMTVTRSYEFSAAHRLHVQELSHDENIALYGKCNNPAGHGHNYELEVTVSGKPDERTGFLIDIGALDDVVNRRVIDRYDHKHLNCDVEELNGKNPTSEIVALAIWDQLNGNVPGVLERVRLWETARNIFEVNRG